MDKKRDALHTLFTAQHHEAQVIKEKDGVKLSVNRKGFRYETSGKQNFLVFQYLQCFRAATETENTKAGHPDAAYVYEACGRKLGQGLSILIDILNPEMVVIGMKKLYERYKGLTACKAAIEAAKEQMIDTYRKDGKVLVCGNGGSCSDSDYIVGELMKGFLLKRSVGKTFSEQLKAAGIEDAEHIVENLQGALPAISLSGQSAILSAFANDVAPEMVYAQLVYGYGKPGDILIGLSTSGNSRNVVYAAKVAKGMKTIALTGQRESELSRLCDITIQVPETETFKVQELHLPVYHYLCAETEEAFFES